MLKKIPLLLFVLAVSFYSSGQDQTNAIVGKASFILDHEELKNLASSVNEAYQAIHVETTTRATAQEVNTKYAETLEIYLEALEKFAISADAQIIEEVHTEINLVKEIQMQLSARNNR